MGQVLDLILPAAMTVAPVAGYVPQYQSIQKTKNSAGFSTFVSLILFISNILRLFFWWVLITNLQNYLTTTGSASALNSTLYSSQYSWL